MNNLEPSNARENTSREGFQLPLSVINPVLESAISTVQGSRVHHWLPSSEMTTRQWDCIEEELEAHSGFMEKIRKVYLPESSSTSYALEQVQNNDENNVFANERQYSAKHAAECADEELLLAKFNCKFKSCTEETNDCKALKKQTHSLIKN
ncbi:hypothetical protein Tco_0169007 [Tanacetum coccineum]